MGSSTRWLFLIPPREEVLVFVEGGKPENPEKNPRSKDENQQQTKNSTHIWNRAGIEPGPHWWEASALTTAPSLLPINALLTTFRNILNVMLCTLIQLMQNVRLTQTSD